MNILGIEFVIYVFSKYNKVLSIVIQITLANHFIIKFPSHTLFSFLHYLSIVGKGKKNIWKSNNNKWRIYKSIKLEQIRRISYIYIYIYKGNIDVVINCISIS
jgi:hypothetical protein